MNFEFPLVRAYFTFRGFFWSEGESWRHGNKGPFREALTAAVIPQREAVSSLQDIPTLLFTKHLSSLGPSRLILPEWEGFLKLATRSKREKKILDSIGEGPNPSKDISSCFPEQQGEWKNILLLPSYPANPRLASEWAEVIRQAGYHGAFSCEGILCQLIEEIDAVTDRNKGEPLLDFLLFLRKRSLLVGRQPQLPGTSL